MFYLEQQSKKNFLFICYFITDCTLAKFNFWLSIKKQIKLVKRVLHSMKLTLVRVSLTNFLISNPEAIYQDHYHFRFNNYSSINCFGKISGVTVIDSDFYISVGTNSFINLIIQGLFWVLLLSRIRIKKDSEKRPLLDTKNIHHNIATDGYSGVLLFFFILRKEIL